MTLESKVINMSGKYLHNYSKKYHFHIGGIKRFLSSKCIVLDLGCGDGKAKELVELWGHEYLALDIEKHDIENFVLGTGLNLPFKNDSFNAILCLKVLEHVPEPHIFIKECYRILKPNGIFIGSAAFLEPYHASSFYHFSPLGIHKLLEDCGFEVLDIAPGLSCFQSISQMMFSMNVAGEIGKIFGDILMIIKRFLAYIYCKITNQMSLFQKHIKFDKFRYSSEFSFIGMKSK